MKIEVDQYLPVGYEVKRGIKAVALLWGTHLLRSFSYLVALGDAHSDLYVYRKGMAEKLLLTDEVMTDFHLLLDGAFSAIPFLVGLCLIMGVLLFAHHFHESRSIYLMRRLPDRWELMRRCITLPLVGIGGIIVLTVILLSIYYGLYMLVTPKLCLTGNQWGKLMANWL